MSSGDASSAINHALEILLKSMLTANYNVDVCSLQQLKAEGPNFLCEQKNESMNRNIPVSMDWSNPRIIMCHINQNIFQSKKKKEKRKLCLIAASRSSRLLEKSVQCGPVICIISVPMRLMRGSSGITSGCSGGCVGEASIQRQSTHSNTELEFCRGRASQVFIF